MPRRSSGWLTVTNSDEFDKVERCEFVGGGRATRNPLGLRERLGGSAAPGECGRLVMDVRYLHRRSNLRKNEILTKE